MFYYESGYKYLYDAEIIYECGDARQFYDDTNDVLHPSQSVTCGWDGLWSETKLMPCQCIHTYLFFDIINFVTNCHYSYQGPIA